VIYEVGVPDSVGAAVTVAYGVTRPTADPRPLRFAYADTRRWVLIGAVIGAVTYLMLSTVNVLATGWGPTRYQLMLLAATVGCVLGGVTAWRGRVFAGGVISMVAVGIEMHSSLVLSPTFPSPSLMATAALVVAGCLLLKPRDSAVVALGTVVLAWPLVLLSPAVRASGVTGDVVFWLTSHAGVTIAVWALVSLGFSIVDRAFLEVVRKERELSETIDRAPDGILVVDASDLVQVVNPAALRLLDLSREQCLGRSINAVLQVEAARTGNLALLQLGDTGERPIGWTLGRADGQQRELEITWRAMDGGRRQLVLRNVSERQHAERVRREMELQLAHAQRLEAVGQLAGGIAHDFNNILTIVGASAEVLRAEMGDDRATPLLDEILAAQERGATLTRQLLAFARRDVVHPRVFDLSEQVLALRRLLQRVAGEQTRLSCDVESNCRVRADIGQVEQALVNLVGNARDAMPNGGTCTLSVVRVRTDDGDTWVQLRVRDEGIGMDEATRARAFEPFFTTKPRGRGTGLGLAAVHGMVLQSGGRADIESTLGLGTVVLLDFPFVEASADVAPSRPAPVATAGGGTVLVAEDDDGTRGSVARILQRLGYSVLLAPDGMQALRMVEAHPGRIDLVLTDVMMPGLSGPQLASRLRAHAPLIPVLFMSGYPEDALGEVEGLQLETDFIAKPFTSEALARRVSDKLSLALGVGASAGNASGT
jgi:two-component system, cell cycle sensor histidine kinase and response regulator CckA